MALRMPADPIRAEAAYDVGDDAPVVFDRPVVRTNWVLPMIAAVIGGAMFLAGLVAAFRVDFSAGWFTTSASVVGFGVSPALAIATLLLGGAALVAALADRDQGATAFIGFLTILVGIGAMIADGQTVEDTLVDVDRQAAVALALSGAVLFIVALVPWWSVRRRRTIVR